jgi:hypothetical protein
MIFVQKSVKIEFARQSQKSKKNIDLSAFNKKNYLRSVFVQQKI